VRRTTDDTWILNGTPVPAVTGAKDIDFGFTPATLTLPYWRLNLGIGDEVETLAARLDIEVERLTPLHLVFRRVANNKYECLKTETGTTSHFLVDAQGIVLSPKGHWIAQT